MGDVNVKIKVLREGFMPVYKHATDAACDCMASIDETVVLKHGTRVSIPLGFALDLPNGWKCDIKPRSGLSRKNGVCASLGTIDNGYKGELACTLFNFDEEEDLVINKGDRICQLEFMPQYRAVFEKVNTLSESDRNSDGFGSTGV